LKNFVVFCIALGFLTSAPAYAQLAPSDVLFCQGGPAIIIPEGGPPGSEFLPAWCPAPGIPNLAFLLFEPGGSVLSDQIWTQNEFFYFASDPDFVDLGPNGLNIPIIGGMVETGAPQDLSPFFGLPPGWAVVQSDVGNEEVPEPASILFAASALLAFGVRRWRMR
jgi:hypothetical protein